MDIVLAAHSGIRWLVLVGLLATVIVAFMRSSRDGSPTDRWLSWVGIVFDIQVVLGLILYVFNEGWDQGGFIAYFHPIGMILAVAAFHMGLGRGKKTGGGAGWRQVGVMTLVSLVLVVAAVPWQRM